MSIKSQFARVSERLIRDHGGVEQGRMLHAAGLKINGRFFAFTTKGELVVKLPAARVEELIATREGRPCDSRKGRPMREWVCLTPADEQACTAYLTEARDFVAGQCRTDSQPADRPRNGSSAPRRRKELL